MNPKKTLLVLSSLLIVASAVYYKQVSGEVAATPSTSSSAATSSGTELLATAMDFSTFTKPDAAILKQQLTPLQYEITQEDGTEKPFNNAYWDNKREGIYVDIVSGEPLFSSTDKYKSGTGWPSFTRPITAEAMVTREDRSWFGVRTELRSRYADSHLGHVFDDGPPPTGLRYCINSAALEFIPREELEAKGYGRFSVLFK